ncbi:hypothetical protein G7046_g1698 [Stylonectria norvegica]|nr:hypothetical protein G7046_g1698 [Stylonectria norvegica]
MTSLQPGELPPAAAEETASSTPQNDIGPSEPEVFQDKAATQTTVDGRPMSKNALKRMRKNQEWEDGKEDRRRQRKERRQGRRVRQKNARAELVAQGINPFAMFPRKPAPINVPITLIVDCDFEGYMRDKELISLASQVTRCYSENRTARFRSHLWIAGFKGKLHDRFRDVLEDKHKLWKGIEFVEDDFLGCAVKAREMMQEKKTDSLIPPLQKSLDEKVSWVRDESDPFPMVDPEPEPNEEYKDVVYLSSDSPYTLERLEPHTSYIIGGIVDKNREKGLCYKRARERGIRTAKLPIGQYMVMQSRQVLATNHVVEIMLKWLEYENWGEAFLSVIPKRKGGQLRGQETTSGGGADEGADEDEDEDDEENRETESNGEDRNDDDMAVDAPEIEDDQDGEKGTVEQVPPDEGKGDDKAEKS